jgi:hypothetical protein
MSGAASNTESSSLSSSNAELVRNALERIYQSPQFARAERLRQFLRFIVDAKLNGSLSDLKESVIGTRVYLRDSNYDPKAEPIVRNEARRLRIKLEEYYQSIGQRDVVIITVPKGGYLPHYEIRHKVVPLPVAPVPPTRRPFPFRNLAFALALLGLGAVAVLGCFVTLFCIVTATFTPKGPSRSPGMPAMNLVAVFPRMGSKSLLFGLTQTETLMFTSNRSIREIRFGSLPIRPMTSIPLGHRMAKRSHSCAWRKGARTFLWSPRPVVKSNGSVKAMPLGLAGCRIPRSSLLFPPDLPGVLMAEF